MNWFNTIIISIAAAFSSLFGAHHATQPVINGTSTSVEVSQTTSTPTPVDVLCPGGVPCPNPGAISVSLPSNVWNVGGTYRVSWTNNLANSSYDFYYVEIGVGTTTPMFPNGGDPGFYRVDGSQDHLDIDFDAHTAEMRILNSRSRNYDIEKNSFFIRVLAMNDNGTPMPQDDKVVAAANSPLFSVQGYAGATQIQPPNVNTYALSQAQAKALNTELRMQADMDQLRVGAEMVYQSNQSYAQLCSSGVVNISANATLAQVAQDIVSKQEASSQPGAGLTCLSNANKYVFGLKYNSSFAIPGVTSFCIDSTGAAGDNTKFTLDQVSMSCEPTQ